MPPLLAKHADRERRTHGNLLRSDSTSKSATCVHQARWGGIGRRAQGFLLSWTD